MLCHPACVGGRLRHHSMRMSTSPIGGLEGPARHAELSRERPRRGEYLPHQPAKKEWKQDCVSYPLEASGVLYVLGQMVVCESNMAGLFRQMNISDFVQQGRYPLCPSL